MLHVVRAQRVVQGGQCESGARQAAVLLEPGAVGRGVVVLAPVGGTTAHQLTLEEQRVKEICEAQHPVAAHAEEESLAGLAAVEDVGADGQAVLRHEADLVGAALATNDPEQDFKSLSYNVAMNREVSISDESN